MKTIREMKGDFGTDVKMGNQPKKCYGKTVDYKMAPKKKVCALNTDSGSGGASGDSGGT
jgi:hypothetical protein